MVESLVEIDELLEENDESTKMPAVQGAHMLMGTGLSFTRRMLDGIEEYLRCKGSLHEEHKDLR